MIYLFLKNQLKALYYLQRHVSETSIQIQLTTQCTLLAL